MYPVRFIPFAAFLACASQAPKSAPEEHSRRDAAHTPEGTLDPLVHVSRSGQLYWNLKPADDVVVAQLVAELNAAGGTVVYLREGIEQQPTAEQMNAFKMLVEGRPRIRFEVADPHPPDPLVWFELEEHPYVSRFSLARGERGLVSTSKGTAILNLGDDGRSSLFATLLYVLRANRLPWTKPSFPERSFDSESTKTPSVSLRFAFSSGGGWRSWYPRGQLPENVQTLLEDCRLLAERVVRDTKTEEISFEEAKKLVQPK